MAGVAGWKRNIKRARLQRQITGGGAGGARYLTSIMQVTQYSSEKEGENVFMGPTK